MPASAELIALRKAAAAVVYCRTSLLRSALLLASGLSNQHIGQHLSDHVMIPRVFIHPTCLDGTTSENGVRALANLILDDDDKDYLSGGKHKNELFTGHGDKVKK